MEASGCCAPSIQVWTLNLRSPLHITPPIKYLSNPSYSFHPLSLIGPIIHFQRR